MNEPITIAYIFDRYPVLSQTFLRREIAALRDKGLRIEIHSLLPSQDAALPPVPGIRAQYFHCWELLKLVVALPWELFRDPSLLRDAWRLYRECRTIHRENFWATLWAIIFALCRAPDFRRHRPDILHGVRATGTATAAAVLSRLCGIPFTFGAHAYDIYRHGGDAFLQPKLRATRFVHTSTENAREELRKRAGLAADKIILSRRGLDRLPALTDRAHSARPIRLLSVGRLVAKKGHREQIAACAILKSQGLPFAARIVGEGPLRLELQRQIEAAGLQNDVILCGALLPQQVETEYEGADIFWHTGVVDATGDQDGLPNVIPEAFAHGLPVISNHLPGAMEAVKDGCTGLVVDATVPATLARAVKRLAEDAALRKNLGANGRRWVEENFWIPANAEILARAFRSSINPRPV